VGLHDIASRGWQRGDDGAEFPEPERHERAVTTREVPQRTVRQSTGEVV
jgi:hypothetical protein